MGGSTATHLESMVSDMPREEITQLLKDGVTLVEAQGLLYSELQHSHPQNARSLGPSGVSLHENATALVVDQRLSRLPAVSRVSAVRDRKSLCRWPVRLHRHYDRIQSWPRLSTMWRTYDRHRSESAESPWRESWHPRPPLSCCRIVTLGTGTNHWV
jgi:hypothetical protein